MQSSAIAATTHGQRRGLRVGSTVVGSTGGGSVGGSSAPTAPKATVPAPTAAPETIRSATPWRATMNSSALMNRAAGSFSSARRTTASS